MKLLNPFCGTLLLLLLLVTILSISGHAQEAPPGSTKPQSWTRELPIQLSRLIHNPQTDLPNLVVFAGGSLNLDDYNQFRLTAKDITEVLPGPQRTLEIVTVYPNSFGIKLWLVISQGEEGAETYTYFPLKDDATRALQLAIAWAMK